MIKRGRATKYLILEAALVVCLFAVGIGLRIYNMPTESYGLGVFFDAASVGSSKAVPYIAGTGINQVYLYMLRGLFLIFGNVWQVGTIAQLVLFFLGAVVFFFAGRRVNGRIGNLLVIGVMLCMPVFLPITYSYGPQMLYFLLFGVGLYYTHSLVIGCKDREDFGILFILQIILTGLYAGLLVYLDLFSVVLVLPVILIPMRMRDNLGVAKGIGVSFLWILSAALAVVCCGFGESMLAGVPMGSLMESWFNYSYGQVFSLPVISYISWEVLLCDRHIWLGLFMAATYVVTLIYFVVYMIFKRTTRQVRELDVESLLMNQLEEEKEPGAEVTAEVNAALEVNEVSDIAEPVKETPVETPPVIQYIENPLPLPKKHEKKTLDYAFQPDFEDMDYDVEVSDKDDYDIK